VLLGRSGNKKILITGGFGCIGGSLGAYLSERGESVSLATRNKHVKPIKGISDCKPVYSNFSDFNSLLSITKNIDCVVHLASVNSDICQNDYELANEVNGVNTQKIIDASIINGVQYFIYFSTAHVYSTPLEGSFTEESDTKSTHPYSTSHIIGENYLKKVIEANEISGAIFRLSNSVGLPVNKHANCWKLIFNDLCRSAIKENTLKIQSNPFIKRDFISLDVVSKITHHFIKKSPKKHNPIFNISSGNSISLMDVGDLISQRYKFLFQDELNLIYSSDGQYDNDLFIDNAKLMNEIEFEICNNLEEKVDELLEYFSTGLNLS